MAIVSAEFKNNDTIYVGDGKDIKIQGDGTTYSIKGKLSPDSSEQIIALVNVATFNVSTEVSDNEVYMGDVSGYYSITIQSENPVYVVVTA